MLISLRGTKNRGDLLETTVNRKILRGFIKPGEWSQTEIAQKTRRVEVSIVFPRGRRCLGATVTQHSTSKTIVLGPQQFQLLVDRRQVQVQ